MQEGTLTQFRPTMADQPYSITGQTKVPPSDIVEYPDRVEILIDMPGVKKEALTLTIEESTLSIVAEPKERDDGSLLMREWSPARRERKFRLSDDLDAAKVSAALSDGTLRIVILKSERSRPRRIEIESN